MELDFEVLENEQRILAQKVMVLKDNDELDYREKAEDVIFSLDIQYQGDEAFVACDVQRFNGTKIGVWTMYCAVNFPYVPQFFGFREAPLLINLIKEIENQCGISPNLILIDGHGLAHQRKCGVACLVGVAFNIATIGCAKEPLLKYLGELKEEKGSFLDVYLQDEVVGRVVRTQKGVKPVFVSAGHLISLEKSMEIVLYLASEYRICEPLRRADQVARAFAKGEKGVLKYEILKSNI